MTIARDHTLGIWMTSGLVVGSMIGSGIFMLPVSLAPLGANTLIGWMLSIFGALAIAYALASLGRTGAGGIHAKPITVARLAQVVDGGGPKLFEPIATGFWIRVRIDTVRALDQQYFP